MARSIHISTARTMLNSLAKPKRFAGKTMTGALSILEFGYRPLAAFVAQRRKNSDGSLLELRDCLSLRYNFYGGWRNVKLLTSGECCKIHDCCIFRVNDCEVFL